MVKFLQKAILQVLLKDLFVYISGHLQIKLYQYKLFILLYKICVFFGTFKYY